MSRELTDMEFEQLLEDEKNRQLVEAIKKLAAVSQKGEQTSFKIAAALQDNSRAIDVFLSKVSELSGVKPNIVLNQDGVVSLLRELLAAANGVAERQGKIIEMLGQKPKRLVAMRNDYGSITHIDIEY